MNLSARHCAHILLSALAAAVIGYLLGAQKTSRCQVDAVNSMQDYAVSNVIIGVAQAKYLEDGRIQEARELLDISFAMHLKRIQYYESSLNLAEFRAKKYALRALWTLWSESLPTTTLCNGENDLDGCDEWIEMIEESRLILSREMRSDELSIQEK